MSTTVQKDKELQKEKPKTTFMESYERIREKVEMGVGEKIAISLGAIWGLLGSIMILIMLGREELVLPSPFWLHAVVSFPAYAWFLSTHQLLESGILPFDILFYSLWLTIPSALIGAGIGYAVYKKSRVLLALVIPLAYALFLVFID